MLEPFSKLFPPIVVLDHVGERQLVPLDLVTEAGVQLCHRVQLLLGHLG